MSNKILNRSLREIYIKAISSKKKTYEGRVNTESFLEYQPGKIVRWFSENEFVITKIITRKIFPSFDDMLREINFKLFIPEAKNYEEAKQVYYDIPGYSEKVKKYGALALGIQLINLK